MNTRNLSTKAALSMGICLLSASCAPTTTSKRVISSLDAPAPVGAYSQGIRAGNTVYVAGQIALSPQTGQAITDTSIEAQTRRALDSVRAILAAAGMTTDNVVMTQVFVTDLDEVPRMNTVYATYFGKEPPARAVVEVSRLPRGVRVEIAATAVK